MTIENVADGILVLSIIQVASTERRKLLRQERNVGAGQRNVYAGELKVRPPGAEAREAFAAFAEKRAPDFSRVT
jgi:hypothetical protein